MYNAEWFKPIYIIIMIQFYSYIELALCKKTTYLIFHKMLTVEFYTYTKYIFYSKLNLQ